MPSSKFDSWCRHYGLECIRKLAEDGYSEEEIALRSGISPSQFKKWIKKYPKFAQAIELGRREADFSVVEAVYKRATGYNVSTSKTHKLKRIDYDPETGKKIREYEELAVGVDEDHIAPDLRAGIFWLKNRQPDRWGEKAAPAEDVDGGGVVEIPSADTIDCLPEDDDGRASE